MSLKMRHPMAIVLQTIDRIEELIECEGALRIVDSFFSLTQDLLTNETKRIKKKLGGKKVLPPFSLFLTARRRLLLRILHGYLHCRSARNSHAPHFSLIMKIFLSFFSCPRAVPRGAKNSEKSISGLRWLHRQQGMGHCRFPLRMSS